MAKSSLLLALLVTLPLTALGGEARIAVAANFAAPAEALTKTFSASSGHTYALSASSTGKLYAQISHGAPFDLLLSADQKTPQMLIDDGLASAASRFTYAKGTLVLWSADDAMLGDGATVLRAGNFRHLAIAAPDLAPYGKAAEQTLAALGLSNAVKAKLVTGENIAQAHQFAVSGNAELGFIAWSQVMKGGQLTGGSVWVVPTDLYQPIKQDAVLLKTGADNEAAKAFLTFLKSETAQAIMDSYGYRRP
ncbi:MAG: molybdate ABC transporter substrate-binding protein [Gammaproteobacteria bacterium]|nr:molybdate ABC transporter substrate-binding protein [Gammaproteobacteria bacterium]